MLSSSEEDEVVDEAWLHLMMDVFLLVAVSSEFVISLLLLLRWRRARWMCSRRTVNRFFVSCRKTICRCWPRWAMAPLEELNSLSFVEGIRFMRWKSCENSRFYNKISWCTFTPKRKCCCSCRIQTLSHCKLCFI